jgi:hypothetical protein
MKELPNLTVLYQFLLNKMVKIYKSQNNDKD